MHRSKPLLFSRLVIHERGRNFERRGCSAALHAESRTGRNNILIGPIRPCGALLKLSGGNIRTIQVLVVPARHPAVRSRATSRVDKHECLSVAVLVFEVRTVATKEEESDRCRNLRLHERKILQLVIHRHHIAEPREAVSVRHINISIGISNRTTENKRRGRSSALHAKAGAVGDLVLIGPIRTCGAELELRGINIYTVLVLILPSRNPAIVLSATSGVDEDKRLSVAILVFEVRAVATKKEECYRRRDLRLAEREVLQLNNRAINLLEGVGNPRERVGILRRLVLEPHDVRRSYVAETDCGAERGKGDGGGWCAKQSSIATCEMKGVRAD